VRAVLVAGSDLAGALNPDLLATADLLVAVDGGANALARVDVLPGVLVGDLDSVSPLVKTALQDRGVELVLLPIAKEVTDTEAALRLVVERGANDIIVLGALGGPRLDHLVGNLFLLTAEWLAGCRVRLVDERHEVLLAAGDIMLEGEQGDAVSLLPLTPEVTQVYTNGLLYPLAGDTLRRAATRSLSNTMTGSKARITHGDGSLLVMRYRATTIKEGDMS
jgi:thiamine pyrophosphokinase